MEKSYIVIPVFTDPFLHPLHKNNKLSFLYVREYDMRDTFGHEACGSNHRGSTGACWPNQCGENVGNNNGLKPNSSGVAVSCDSKNNCP